ncbi:hypothetical protein CMV_024242 [Castanea mollissima]|uniref:Jacalin-type lectin domain-containing protein n=1 Tax=Castanea mollissima TaxID=60419 RepID=A0A8J4V9V3_9ROSI|nr:hypothetical protein CMV_024242 [Castanea mollissima]
MRMEENLKVGPWGGEDGKNSWSFKANKGGISEIVIMQGWAIDAISFKSDDRSGTFQYSDKFGGNGGKTEKIMIDWPREYLTSIIGTYQSVWPFGPVVIKSLHIITNVTKYGPYGYEFGTPFSFLAEGGEIVGFHGRSECFVNSIGVYVKSLIPFCASNPDYTMQQELDDNTMNVVVPRGVGPWGGNGGKQWDDGVFSSIHELHLHVGDSAVHAIQLFYESSEGKIVRSQKHGGTGGDQIHKIKLDASTEFLVGIMGFYGPVKGNDDYEALRSITLYTNNGRYGPFGEEIGTSFTSSASRGKVVGFHGRSGIYLDAIGIHMEYF